MGILQTTAHTHIHTHILTHKHTHILTHKHTLTNDEIYPPIHECTHTDYEIHRILTNRTIPRRKQIDWKCVKNIRTAVL